MSRFSVRSKLAGLVPSMSSRRSQHNNKVGVMLPVKTNRRRATNTTDSMAAAESAAMDSKTATLTPLPVKIMPIAPATAPVTANMSMEMSETATEFEVELEVEDAEDFEEGFMGFET